MNKRAELLFLTLFNGMNVSSLMLKLLVSLENHGFAPKNSFPNSLNLKRKRKRKQRKKKRRKRKRKELRKKRKRKELRKRSRKLNPRRRKNLKRRRKKRVKKKLMSPCSQLRRRKILWISSPNLHSILTIGRESSAMPRINPLLLRLFGESSITTDGPSGKFTMLNTKVKELLDILLTT